MNSWKKTVRLKDKNTDWQSQENLFWKKNGQLRAEIESMEWKFKIKQRETESTKTQCKQ